MTIKLSTGLSISLIAAMGLSACQTTTGGSTGGGSTGGGSTTTAPNYTSNGFVATQSNSISKVSVVTLSGTSGTTGRTVLDHNISTPTSLTVDYDPTNDTLRVATTAQDAEGGPDSEDVTFTGAGPDYGTASPNYARLNIGTWAYAAEGQIDFGPGNGTHRHNFVAVDGDVYSQPTSGTASYVSQMTGTVDRYDSVGSETVPFVANGTIGVVFNSTVANNVGGTFDVDSSQSNGMTGTITVTGDLDGTSGFSGTSSASLDVQSTPAFPTTNPTGTMSGTLAGPNAQEMVGVVALETSSSAASSTSVVGAWLGADSSR